MARNIEIKARLPSLEAAHAIARSLGGAPHVLRQRDTYFCAATGRLKLRELDDGTVQLIAYRRANEAGPRPSDYQICPLPDAEPLKTVLREALGVQVQVTKTRTLYFVGPVRIHLDQVDGLGAFLEFEDVLTSPEQDDGGRVAALMRQFGIGPDQLVQGSYADLLMGRSPGKRGEGC